MRVANGQPFAVVSDPIRRQNVAFSEFPALCLESGRVDDRSTVAYVVRVADGQPSAAVMAVTFVHFSSKGLLPVFRCSTNLADMG